MKLKDTGLLPYIEEIIDIENDKEIMEKIGELDLPEPLKRWDKQEVIDTILLAKCLTTTDVVNAITQKFGTQKPKIDEGRIEKFVKENTQYWSVTKFDEGREFLVIDMSKKELATAIKKELEQ